MATRFQFRLESLLKLRRALEEEAQRHFAKTMQARNAVEARLKALEEEHARTFASRKVEPGSTVDLQRLRAIERYLLILERRIDNARQDLAAAELQVVEARKALTKAHQAHLMLVRLKERRHEQHQQEVLLEEINAMNEIAVMRYRFNLHPTSSILIPEVTP